MEKHIGDIMEEVSELNIKLKQILYHSQYDVWGDLSGLVWDESDAEQLFMLDNLKRIVDKIDDISHTLDYLDKSIVAEGNLCKNANGRYEVQGIELTSGCGLEYLANDDRHMRYDEGGKFVSTPYWCSSRIEHNGADYYIVGAVELGSIENVRVRIRR